MIRILLADDNVEFCEILREAIDAQEDMECIACVHDGEAALAAIREHSPDLIILDHVMPNLDGLGVLEAIRGAEHRPKVLMLTAFGHENLIQRASNLGADYYIMKPFDIPTLIVRVRQIADPASAAATFQQERRRQLIEKQVAKQLSTLGVPPHFKGYMYPERRRDAGGARSRPPGTRHHQALPLGGPNAKEQPGKGGAGDPPRDRIHLDPGQS